MGLIHSLALQCGFTSIKEEGNAIFLALEQVDFDSFSILAKTYPLKLLPSLKPCLKLTEKPGESALTLLSSFLTDLSDLQKSNSRG